ncbi:MAG: hypothetical protein LUE99_11850 [Bacteroides sp.]|nr:hypothetical protein [Bacteroides sp.]
MGTPVSSNGNCSFRTWELAFLYVETRVPLLGNERFSWEKAKGMQRRRD